MSGNDFDALLAISADNIFYLNRWLATVDQAIIGISPIFILITTDTLSSPTLILPVSDLGFLFDGPLCKD